MSPSPYPVPKLTSGLRDYLSGFSKGTQLFPGGELGRLRIRGRRRDIQNRPNVLPRSIPRSCSGSLSLYHLNPLSQLVVPARTVSDRDSYVGTIVGALTTIFPADVGFTLPWQPGMRSHSPSTIIMPIN